MNAAAWHPTPGTAGLTAAVAAVFRPPGTGIPSPAGGYAARLGVPEELLDLLGRRPCLVPLGLVADALAAAGWALVLEPLPEPAGGGAAALDPGRRLRLAVAA